MKIPGKILVVLKNTKWNDSLHKTVMKLSGKYGAGFAFLHVIPKSKKDDQNINDEITEFNNSLTDSKIKLLEQELEYGDIDKIILEKETALKPDLVIIDGGKNHRNVEEFILKIVPETKASVWAVERSRSPDLNKIICPVDFSDTSKRALRNALLLAGDFGSELMILTVKDYTESTSVFMKENMEKANEESIKDGKNEINSLLKELDAEGINPGIKVRLGDPAEEIDSEIIEWGADLLVIGTHGRSGIRKKLLGSVAEKVARKIPSSFLIIKSDLLAND